MREKSAQDAAFRVTVACLSPMRSSQTISPEQQNLFGDVPSEEM
jgi:hypothetical protein